MALWHVLVIFFSVYIIGFLGAKWAVSFAGKRYIQNAGDIYLPVGLVILLGLAIGAVFFTHTLTPAFVFCYYAMLAMGLVALVFSDIKTSKLGGLWGWIGLCFLSTYFFPSMPLYVGGFTGLLVHAGLGLSWALFIWIFRQMDRVPFLSMILSTSMALCYFLLSGFFPVIPVAFGYLAISIVVVQMGVNMSLKSKILPHLGQTGTGLIGFLWGFFAVYMIALGHPTAAVILYAYPAMEIILSALISMGLYHQLSLKGPFLIEQALSKNIMPTKVMRTIMLWGVLTAALAALSVVAAGMSAGVFYFATIIILINTYLRLTSWGEARPKFKDIAQDLKNGFIQAKNEWGKIPLKSTYKKNTDVNKASVNTSGVPSNATSSSFLAGKNIPQTNAVVSAAPAESLVAQTSAKNHIRQGNPQKSKGGAAKATQKLSQKGTANQDLKSSPSITSPLQRSSNKKSLSKRQSASVEPSKTSTKRQSSPLSKGTLKK